MKQSKHILFLLLGILASSMSFGLIIVPFHFVAGGVTGFALVFHSYFSISLSHFISLINTLLLILAVIFIGKTFIYKTLLASYLFPILMHYFEKYSFYDALKNDPLLASILAGLLLGIGSGLILKANASSGGYDIIGYIINKYFHIKIAYICFILDSIMILLQVKNINDTIYGIIVIFVSMRLTNYLLSYGVSVSKITIISSKYDSIADNLLHIQDIGLTYLHGETGYMHKQTNVLIAITPYTKINLIKEVIRGIDEHAFVIIEDVHSVLGNRFTY